MISAVATRCRLTYGNRARGFHQGPSNQLLTNRPVIVTQSFLCSSALQFRGSPYSRKSAAGRTHDLYMARRLAARPLWIEGLGALFGCEHFRVTMLNPMNSVPIRR